VPEPFERRERRGQMHYCAIVLLAILVVVIAILVVLA
jgi:hypothetical protein